MLKKKPQLLAILLSVLLVSLSGCDQTQYYNVKCDSGFETGVSRWTYIDDGVIEWRKEEHLDKHKRKMLPGEVCTDIKVKKAN